MMPTEDQPTCYKSLYLSRRQIKGELECELINNMVALVRASPSCIIFLSMPTQIPHSQMVVFKTPYNADYMQIPALDRLAFSGMFSRIIALPLKSMIIRFSTRGNPTYDWSLATIFDALITSADLQPAEIRCKEIQFIDVG
jgi:hypothetical protein